jgi:hypothetical protein
VFGTELNLLFSLQISRVLISEGKEERIKQFRENLEKMRSFNSVAFFGGDTNIRVREEKRSQKVFQRQKAFR